MKTRKGIPLLALAVGAVTLCALCMPAMAAKKDKEVKVRKVELSVNTASISVNQTRTLIAYVTPTDAEDKAITWESSDHEIVTILDNGVIMGVSPGTAEITATSVNGRWDTCVVTVRGTVLPGVEQEFKNEDNVTAGIDNGEVLTAATVRVDVEKAVKEAAKGETAYVTYKDKTTVSTAALRGAAYTAQYQGGSARLRFLTTDSGGNTQAQLTIDPEQAPQEDKTLRVDAYIDTGDALAQARERFGSGAVVLRLGQTGSYGMTVQVSVQADLSGLNSGVLRLYRLENGAYTPLDSQSHTVTDNGFLRFSLQRGGTIVIADN